MTGVMDDVGNEIAILLKDAPSYMTEEFFQALHVFYTTENLGVLPFGGGWAEQPEWIVTVLNTLKSEQSKYEVEQIRRERNTTGKK